MVEIVDGMWLGNCHNHVYLGTYEERPVNCPECSNRVEWKLKRAITIRWQDKEYGEVDEKDNQVE